MSEEVKVPVESVAQETKGGKVTFANEVIAIIASLAAGEVKGLASMSGSTFEGITEKFGRKSYTKGVKVEVGNEEAAVDLFVVVRYGYRIHDVCVEIQNAVKNAIETMTGLRVVEVNVNVTGIQLEKELKEEPAPPVKEEEPPRVR
ncbi:MAG: Asp23/Gls24 family envelope stress response protein [Christensenellales bacterium]|jgi:uncharacterized alkaline shock family protein YloU